MKKPVSTQAVVLQVLSRESPRKMTQKEIIASAHDHTDGQIVIHPGGVSIAMLSLLAQALAKEHGGSERSYSLTAEGKREAARVAESVLNLFVDVG